MGSEVNEKLKQLWNILNNDIKFDVRDKWWQNIQNEYRDNKFRKHYDMSHMARMFTHLDEFQSSIKSVRALSYAIFFTNLSYDPKSSDNEEKSIELFKEFANEAEISQDDQIRDQVLNLILATKTHLTEEHKSETIFGTEDKHYFLDFDLSYLGSDSDSYTTNALKIRQEYEFMNEMTYKLVRAKVLNSLLEIPKIFATEAFHTIYESQARNNIKCEIEILEA